VNAPRLQVDAIQGHRLWSASYDSDPNPTLALEFRVAGRFLGDLRGRRFVDIACGTGRWMTEARRRGASAIGIDLCREMLQQAARKPGANGRLAQADAGCLPLAADCADLVMCAFSLGYLRDLQTAMAELARITRRGGRIILSDIHPEGLRRGWTRSFRVEGRVFELRHHAHSAQQWREAARQARLALVEWVEPRFGHPERSLFQRAGKEELFAAARETPAALIAVWRR
jgi:ubiquinone/menaquinone biosynthesis C-methylase UbiE